MDRTRAVGEWGWRRCARNGTSSCDLIHTREYAPALAISKYVDAFQQLKSWKGEAGNGGGRDGEMCGAFGCERFCGSLRTAWSRINIVVENEQSEHSLSAVDVTHARR